MKNIENENTMVPIKVASKELGVPKGKIKDMIKNKEIYYTLENGVYMVDISTIKNYSTITIKTFDMKKELISDYVSDWTNKFYPASTLQLAKVGIYPFESNTFNVNQFILKKFNKSEIDNITNKLMVCSPIKYKNNFDSVTKRTQFYSENMVTYETELLVRDPKDYCIFEFDNYIILLHWDLNNGLGITISDIWEKENFNLLKPFTKTITLSTISQPIYSDKDFEIAANPAGEHMKSIISHLGFDKVS